MWSVVFNADVRAVGAEPRKMPAAEVDALPRFPYSLDYCMPLLGPFSIPFFKMRKRN